MPNELQQLADRCAKIKAELQALRGSRDYQDRARRIALRVEYREAYRDLRDKANDLKIGLAVGFPWERNEADRQV